MTNRTEWPSRGRASRLVTFTAFALLSLCLPGAASAQWATSGTNISNTNTGNVGVGTTTPVSKLHTAGTITAGPVDGDVYRMFGWTNGNLGWAITNSTSGVFSIAQRGDNWADEGTRLVIDRGGNVGVGTTTPVSKLHAAGTVTVGPVDGDVYRMSGWTNGDLRWAITNSASGVFSIAQRGDNWVDQGTRFLIDRGGNVGVGTTTPATRLHVAGDIKVDGNINAKYQDVAEWVPSTQKLAAGAVVVLDPERPNHVLASTSSYDTAVAGVISVRPGLTLGESGEGKALVATTGRVKVKVNATRAPIKIGDLLVTSDVPGVAMKSEPTVVGGRKIHAPGTIIGKALEPLASGAGQILVLLSLQ